MNYIRKEIFNAFPSTKYDNGDIQSVKSSSVSNATRMLPLTELMYIYTIKNDDPKQFNVDIHRYIQRKPVQDVFAPIMAAKKPTMMKYKSNWGVNDVVSFQVGYEAAVNKEGCLKSLTKDIKPSII